jgi:hypothetical protein
VVLAYFAGLLISGLAYFFTVNVIFGGHANPNISSDNLFALELSLIFPISLFIGGCVTGFLSRPFIRGKRRKYLLFSPGLFLAGIFLIFLITARWFTQSLKDAFFWLLLSFWWMLTSATGIFVGFKIQEKRQYKPPSLDL